MSYTEKPCLNRETTSLSDRPIPTADTPPAQINPSFEPKDNPFLRTIHALLRPFKKQSKPDNKKRKSLQVDTDRFSKQRKCTHKYFYCRDYRSGRKALYPVLLDIPLINH
ncbi:hypothetical protein EZS27_019372 [termite gut metagenome]|uniref:Uncharacterized protein n=1 Tax=termite gut metagenome TaxID=433724 RepID=A0A5J4RDB4_9ZZZZ